MREKYIPQQIEKKWQKIWEDNKAFETHYDPNKKKYYVLEMFPYPSGNLHMGHVRNYSIGDVVARFKKMQGFNVIHPMGFDAFGMPAENAAIQHGIAPVKWTYSNIDNMTRQQKELGLSYDWDRKVLTCSEDYYKHTQKLFEIFYKKGLAYKKEAKVNWCNSCHTVLANEQVEEGKCWRCKNPVVKKDLSQWFLKITAYADRLLADLDHMPGWPERVKTMQRNWIGRSTGTQFSFTVEGMDEQIPVYTTRVDTVYGVTYMVLAPEHPLVPKLIESNPDKASLETFIERMRNENDIVRTAEDAPKEGMFTGSYAIHPLTGERIPIWIANYVLYEYGTGAVMAVPQGDQRDWEFAKKYNLPVKLVIQNKEHDLKLEDMDKAYDTDGFLVNSGKFDGLTSGEAREAITKKIEEMGIGNGKVNYRLRDWLISRQRYWGCPIPIIHCPHCGNVLVPEKDLPVVLPEDVNFVAGATSPLETSETFLHCKCPQCGADATRETDTMDTFIDSSWYFLRYMDPHCKDALASKEALEYWSPVDWYNGGMEHTTLHLLYSRFWHKFLYDIGVVPTAEPYQKRTAHGMILGLNPHSFVNLPAEEQEKLLKEYGSQKAAEKALEEKYGEMSRHPIVKMSKSLGNVVNPDDVVKAYGADTMRLYIMFIGDFEKVATWSDDAVKGCKRFLDRVWALSDKLVEGEGYRPAMETLMHQTIKKVSADIESLKMNTAIAQLMTLVNTLYDNGGATKAEYETVVQLLNPFAPHMTEELWEKLGHSHDEQLAYYPWPAYEEAKCVEAAVEIAVQVNGKVKARLKVPADITAEDAIATAKADPAVAAALEGKQLVKEIYVKGRLVNLAAKG